MLRRCTSLEKGVKFEQVEMIKKKMTSTTLKDHVTKMLLFKDSEQLFGRRAAGVCNYIFSFQALFQTFDSR